MVYFIFVFILFVLIFFVKKRPGIVISYILFFQQLNKLTFSEIGLYEYRYSTTILMIIILLFKYRNLNYLKEFKRIKTNNIIIAWVFILIYIFLYMLVNGFAENDIKYILPFIFPGVILFFVASTMITKEKTLKDLFIGLAIFFPILFIQIISTKGLNGLSARTSEIETLSSITQGRIAGMYFVLSFFIIMHKKRLIQFIGVFSIIISLIWLGYTGTRGALISILLTIVLIYVLTNNTNNKKILFKKLLFFGIIIVPVLLYFGFDESLLFQRTGQLLNDNGITSMRRYDRWIIFFDLSFKNLLFGLGVDGWSKYLGFYDYPHNVFIDFVANYGLVGLVSFTLIVYAFFKVTKKVFSNNIYSIYYKGITALSIFTIFSYMFSSTIFNGPSYFVIFSGVIVSLNQLILKRENSK